MLVLVHSMFTCSHFQVEFIVVNFLEIHYKMSEMLSELGPYFFEVLFEPIHIISLNVCLWIMVLSHV